MTAKHQVSELQDWPASEYKQVAVEQGGLWSTGREADCGALTASPHTSRAPDPLPPPQHTYTHTHTHMRTRCPRPLC